MLLDASCHKKHEIQYIWFKGRDLYCFQDIKSFMKLRGWGMRGHARGNFPVNIIRNNNIYIYIYGLL